MKERLAVVAAIAVVTACFAQNDRGLVEAADTNRLASVVRDLDVLASSHRWEMPQPVFGQIRLVPDKVLPHVASEVAWEGPWERHRQFEMEIGSAAAHQSAPGNFDFVFPRICLRGYNEQSTEAFSTTVRLFDRASRPGDIQIKFHSLPRQAELEQEYEVATISGEDALVAWTVFVRFTQKEPDYVRRAGQDEPAGLASTSNRLSSAGTPVGGSR